MSLTPGMGLRSRQKSGNCDAESLLRCKCISSKKNDYEAAKALNFSADYLVNVLCESASEGCQNEVDPISKTSDRCCFDIL